MTYLLRIILRFFRDGGIIGHLGGGDDRGGGWGDRD